MLRIIRSVTAVLLVLALSLGLVACGASKPSQKTFEKVYEKQIDSVVDTLGDYNDALDTFDMSGMKIDANVSVDLSDELLMILRSMTSYDLSFINDMNISLSDISKDGVLAVELGLDYSGKKLIAIKEIVDRINGDVLMGVPGLSDSFMKLSVGDIDMEEMADLLKRASDSSSVKELVPDGKVLAGLLGKVFDTIMANLGEVSFEEKDIVVAGVGQSCVEYTVTITEKDVVKAAVAVLELLKTDGDFKTLVCDLMNGVLDFYEGTEIVAELSGYTAEDIYAELVSQIDAAAAELVSENEATDDVILVWKSYITDKDEIIGITFEAIADYEGFVFHFAETTGKNDTGIEIYFDVDEERIFEVSGKLTENKNLIAGTLELEAAGSSMAFIDFENVNAKKLENGVFEGSVILSPSKGLIDLIGELSDSDLSVAGLALSGYSLRIDVVNDGIGSCKMTCGVQKNGENFVSLSVDVKLSKGEKIDIPANTTEDLDAWAASLDLNGFLDNVKNSGLPEYVVEMVESLVTMLQYQ